MGLNVGWILFFFFFQNRYKSYRYRMCVGLIIKYREGGKDKDFRFKSERQSRLMIERLYQD